MNAAAIPECPHLYACQWNGKEWVRVHRKDETAPERPLLSPRRWLAAHVDKMPEAKLAELFKALRRIEHPDRGGNAKNSATIGQYLETYFREVAK